MGESLATGAPVDGLVIQVRVLLQLCGKLVMQFIALIWINHAKVKEDVMNTTRIQIFRIF